MKKINFITGLSPLKAVGVLMVSSFILMGASCPRTDPSISVTNLPVKVLMPSGTVNDEMSYTVGVNHRYQVEAKVEFLSDRANFNPPDTGVSIVWVNPITNREDSAKVQLKPGETDVYTFILPQSESLGLCQAYFYRWSVVYDITGGARGVYLGEGYYVLPSKRRVSSNSIQQAFCAAPESPWGF